MLCCGVAACHRYGVCTVHCVECDSQLHSTQCTVRLTLALNTMNNATHTRTQHSKQ